MSTNVLSAKDIKREKHTIDASGKILGRLATQAATPLMGKNKQSLPFPDGKGKPKHWVPYLDTGDYVVIINASKVKVTGKKFQDKKYTRHSGYPGGLKVETFDKLQSRLPEYIIEHAIKGMLPGNKLGQKMIKKLTVYKGEATK